MAGDKFVIALWNEDISKHTRSTQKSATEVPLFFTKNTPRGTFCTVSKVSLLMTMQPVKHWL